MISGNPAFIHIARFICFSLNLIVRSRRIGRGLVCLFTAAFAIIGSASADPGLAARSDFFVPSELRERVDFWADIFTKYGKYHSVIHHRDFPQAVFDVVDMTVEGKLLNDIQFAKYKKQTVEKRVEQVQQALRRLAQGKEAAGPLEKRIVAELAFLPGGSAKYGKIVKDDLVRSQTGISERYREAVVRSGRYMRHMEQIFREEGLPIELTRMPFIESSFDYTARSSVGASGIWQFMLNTGRTYMTINHAIDERLDPLTATKAAARYLKHAYGRLGSWPLAATSYNHGVAGVARKVKEFGSSNIVKIIEHPTKRVFGFASTNFYPELLAAIEIYDAREKYFPGIKIEKPIAFEEYRVPAAVYVSSLVKPLGSLGVQLETLNYSLLPRVWSNRVRIPAGHVVKLPRGGLKRLSGVKFEEPAEGSIRLAADGELLYRVQPGDTLSKIASKHSTYIATIKKLNELRSDVVKVGQTLVIRPGVKKVIRSGTGGTTQYRVEKGDTLIGIARRYGTTVEALKSTNGLKSSSLRIGQSLRIPGEREPVHSGDSASKVEEPPRHHGSAYTVVRGDSLYSIARRTGRSVAELKRLNRLSGNSIKIGQTLQLGGAPRRTGSVKYRVKRGDTLWKIAELYGVAVQEIENANDMKARDLKFGDEIVIPK